jgi:superfamily I DNA/RNA helicase
LKVTYVDPENLMTTTIEESPVQAGLFDPVLSRAQKNPLLVPIASTVAAASTDDDEEPVGEFQVAEYIIFLLALDTYERYAEETAGVDNVEDILIKRGLRILRMADTQLEAYGDFLESHLEKPSQKAMLRRALNLKAFNPAGAARRALQFRTLLTRGGTSTVKGILENPKYVRQVKQAIAASMLDDSDKALDIFSAIPMLNIRMRDWIDDAAKQAGSGQFAPEPVDSASNEISDSIALTTTSIKEVAAVGAQETQTTQDSRSAMLATVQVNATAAAKKSLEINQKPDEPPKQSEVVGIATAVAVAAISDPSILQNIPAPLKDLDEEQRAAALTGGRVRVAAGAGSGKSTTLVARIEYLVKDGRVNPARVMACSFNTKAALELKEKIAGKLQGAVGTTGVQVGTMHALFKKLIVGNQSGTVRGFGTPEEQAMLKPPRLVAPPWGGQKTINPSSLSITIRNMWEECGPDAIASRFGFPREWVESPPKAKKAGLLLNAWRGNDVTLEQAKASVSSQAEAQAVVWYEMYLGLKGDIPGWRPPCNPSKPFESFMFKNRKGGERLGDLDDMLKVLRDILRRDPRARGAIQGMYDHILVDECQDLNTVQHQIFAMLSEHIPADSKDKSIWMVGDVNQAIYQFRGAKPELFQALEEGWTTKSIRTNYRCQPEIVDAANRLIERDNDGTILELKTDPRKDRGRASIQVSVPDSNVEAAIETIGRYRKDIEDGAKVGDFAVLARTNAELNDFETACIINEIPYIRRGGRGFLEAPESRAVLGYIDLATGNDYEMMKGSLMAILTKPDRGVRLSQDDLEKAVKEALNEVARKERVDVKNVRPDILLESNYVRVLADNLKKPYRLAIIDSMVKKGKTLQNAERFYGHLVDDLANNLRGISPGLKDLQDYIGAGHTTEELLNYILDNTSSTVKNWDARTRTETFDTATLREQISEDAYIYSDDEQDVDEEDKEVDVHEEIGEEGLLKVKEKSDQGKGLGAVQFLFELMKPNENDQKEATDPTMADGYVKKLARYSRLGASLKVDPAKWEKDQQALPPDDPKREKKPAAITLSTVHSVKGAQWPNVTVVMPKGLFPMERKPRPDEPPPDPATEAALMKAERNLAYVALTRAEINLEVTCPKGMSPFVFDAGLAPGENVPKPGVAPQEITKESSDLLDFTHPDEEL